MPLNVVTNHAANVARRNLVKTDMEATGSLSGRRRAGRGSAARLRSRTGARSRAHDLMLAVSR